MPTIVTADPRDLQRATDYWTKRINTGIRRKNAIVREFREVRARREALERELLSIQTREARLRGLYNEATASVAQDQATWESMKRGLHPLGQR